MKDEQLGSLSIKELRELRGRVEQAIVVVEQREKSDLMDKMAELAAEHGLSLADVVAEMDAPQGKRATTRK